jgi:hypothetical protein
MWRPPGHRQDTGRRSAARAPPHAAADPVHTDSLGSAPRSPAARRRLHACGTCCVPARQKTHALSPVEVHHAARRRPSQPQQAGRRPAAHAPHRSLCVRHVDLWHCAGRPLAVCDPSSVGGHIRTPDERSRDRGGACGDRAMMKPAMVRSRASAAGVGLHGAERRALQLRGSRELVEVASAARRRIRKRSGSSARAAWRARVAQHRPQSLLLISMIMAASRHAQTCRHPYAELRSGMHCPLFADQAGEPAGGHPRAADGRRGGRQGSAQGHHPRARRHDGAGAGPGRLQGGRAGCSEGDGWP